MSCQNTFLTICSSMLKWSQACLPTDLSLAMTGVVGQTHLCTNCSAIFSSAQLEAGLVGMQLSPQKWPVASRRDIGIANTKKKNGPQTSLLYVVSTKPLCVQSLYSFRFINANVWYRIPYNLCIFAGCSNWRYFVSLVCKMQISIPSIMQSISEVCPDGKTMCSIEC